MPPPRSRSRWRSREPTRPCRNGTHGRSSGTSGAETRMGRRAHARVSARWVRVFFEVLEQGFQCGDERREVLGKRLPDLLGVDGEVCVHQSIPHRHNLPPRDVGRELSSLGAHPRCRLTDDLDSLDQAQRPDVIGFQIGAAARLGRGHRLPGRLQHVLDTDPVIEQHSAPGTSAARRP